MAANYVVDVGKNFSMERNEPIMPNLFQQYERVIIESLITTFGLDFIVKDRHGGDVDTIHNVRQIGTDPEMTYKNLQNQRDYDNRGDYNSKDYHSGTVYQTIKHDAREKYRETGQTAEDAYAGRSLHFLGKTTKENADVNAELDHVISAEKIHNDRGRVLSGLSGEKLANCEDNLKFTNARLNRSLNNDEIPDYIAKHPELDDGVKKKMMEHYNKAQKNYEQKLARAYYTSPKFAKDLALSSGKVGIQMGIRQAVGFVFTEVWFAVKEEFQKIGDYFDLGDFFRSIAAGIKRGFENAKAKYKEIFSRFVDGALAGALSSLFTTICNIFFTTAKNVVRIIRQAWTSLTSAAKVLFINPDNYSFGERIRAVAKILATGASMVAGVMVEEAIRKTPVNTIPIVGDVIPVFCGTLLSGIMSCTFLYVLDRNEMVNKLVRVLDSLPSVSNVVNYFRQQADYFERYAAELMQIDIETFRKETAIFNDVAIGIEAAQTEDELNKVLKAAVKALNIKLPWDNYDSFDAFMRDKNAKMVFE